jgi:hypothetical protein
MGRPSKRLSASELASLSEDQRLVARAVDHAVAEGESVKSIALTAGLNGNVLSMFRGDTKVPLERVPGLVAALKTLDEPELTLASLGSHFRDQPNAQEAIVRTIMWFAQQPPAQTQILEVVNRVLAEAAASGLTIPEPIPVATLMAIEVALRAAIQEETAARMV